MPQKLLILGTRGVPAAHGGFETFAERLALHLVARGWDVTVYCQREASPNSNSFVDVWRGIRRIHINTSATGPVGTMEFDWACVRHALGEPGIPLVLGYNTAIFTLLLRIAGRPVLMNMDGIEWRRAKWGAVARGWFYVNEWCGALFSTVLIADNPAIADHLARRRKREDIVTIAYGADLVNEASMDPILALGLIPGKYLLSIGRIEPENSILEMVSAYSARLREYDFVCLGALDPVRNSYHADVLAAAKGRVIFPGAIYDPERVQALRLHALAYCHGHTVGGTNPSLVEAMGAGSPIIAHDNKFNRWVAGDSQLYFRDVESLTTALDYLEDNNEWRAASGRASRSRFEQEFTWDRILGQYEALCLRYSHHEGK